jgi:hypothetical protein
VSDHTNDCGYWNTPPDCDGSCQAGEAVSEKINLTELRAFGECRLPYDVRRIGAEVLALVEAVEAAQAFVSSPEMDDDALDRELLLRGALARFEFGQDR